MVLGALLAASLVATAIAAPPAQERGVTYDFDIPSQNLGDALQALALASRHKLLYSSQLVQGKRSAALRGEFTAEEAVRKLLSGTDLSYEVTSDGIVLIRATAIPSTSNARDSSIQELEEIVVTGTHIRGATAIGSPVIVIDRAEIERAGYSSAFQILQSLPQNYGMGPTENTSASGATGRQGASINVTYGSGLNLRGLGSHSTLTLINGRRAARSGRAGSLFDVSAIPFAAIERVEVLTDGASAIYGSDAIGGVVNFILRKEFDGAETSVSFGSVTDGHMSETQLSHAQGWSWNSGSLLATVEYSDRDNLATADRDVYTDDLRRFGGPDSRTLACNPGNITRGAAVFGIPAGQGGTALTPDQLLAGQPNRCDRRIGTDALPQQERISAFVSARQELSPTVDLFGEALFSRRNFHLRKPTSGVSTLTVPTTNPWYINPFGGPDQPINVEYGFIDDVGVEVERGHAVARSFTLGSEIDLLRGWSAELYSTYSQSEERLHRDNTINTFHLNRLLASSDPAVAFNPFGDGTNNNPATVAQIEGYAIFDRNYTIWEGGAKADGALFSLPGGKVGVAIGTEYRHETFDPDSLSFVSTPGPVRSTDPSSSRNVAAAFAELSVPIVGTDNALPGMQALSLSLAARVENYSDFGRTENPKFGFSWVPATGLQVRGSYGTSFRAPTFDDTRSDATSNAYFVMPLPDPTAPGGITNTLALLGRNSDVQPEQGKSWTVGLDVAPERLPQFTANLTYFSIEYTDKITDISEFLFQALTEPALASRVQLDPTQAQVDALVASPYYFGPALPPGVVGAIADLRISNLAAEFQRGLDLDLGYRLDTSLGRIGVGLSGTYLFEDTQKLSATSREIEVHGTIVGPVDLRLRGRLTWDRGPLNATLFVNYVDSYQNTNNTPVTPIESWTTVDMNLNYTPGSHPLLKGVRVSLAVQNLFDRDPPVAVTASGGFYPIAFDPQNASALGRFVALRLRKDW